MINDNREDKSTPYAFVSMTDTFLSGWGLASQGRSIYVLAVANEEEADIVIRNGISRPEMKYVRVTRRIPRPKIGDRVSVVDRSMAAAWYRPNSFPR